METLKLSLFKSATVRLIPSTAIDPFITIKSIILLSAQIVNHTALSSLTIEVIVPVPSICPDTICPPNLDDTDIARSRFTMLLTLRLPNDDFLIVSAITSALNPLESISVTVRQTPFTAMLSPILTSSII